MATATLGGALSAQMLKAQKKLLRKSLTATLSKIPAASLDEQSEAIAARVLALPAFKRAAAVCCYLNMPSGEVRTTTLVDSILRCDKKLFVPRVLSKDGVMEFFRVYSSQDLASLPANSWGIREPPDAWQGQQRGRVLADVGESLDIILVPGVAFDHTFARLGHGKGFYDRFFTSYANTERPRPLLVGLALREQMLPTAPDSDAEPQIPMLPHDWRLDMIITPDETLAANPTESSLA